MTSVDPAALEQTLSSLDVRFGFATRTTLTRDALLPLPSGTATLVYIVEGELTGELGADAVCTVNGSTGAPAGIHHGAVRTLHAGDALVSLGGRDVVLESAPGARLMTAKVELDPLAAGILPDLVFVTGFAALEPAAAALAANLGPADPTPADLAPADPTSAAHPAPRSGDPLICRMMVSTVLLSVIRAWAQLGCAPQGWPARTQDPYLDRVVSAIHAEPGRDWTLDSLATVGAMSRSVFAERFRATVGQSPASYVSDVRMRQAKDLLDAGRTVSETSRELGYASDEGFSRAFRRHTGVVPSLWRSQRAVPV